MTALPPSGAFAKVDPVHVAEVGPAAAILFGWISWRCADGTPWRASRDLLSQETGLTPDTLRSAIRVLKDRGWVTTTRSSSNDPTVVWLPVFAGQKVMGNIPSTDGEKPRHPVVGQSPITSIETGRDNYQDTHAADGDVEPEPLMPEPADTPALFAVPDDAAAAGPPKTAQTLVARWCDGYRSRTGTDAPKAFMGRVAGQARNLAKACGEDHDEWVAAYNAAFAAGQAGQADATRFLVQTQRPTTAKRNVFADPAMGGPSGDAMVRFQQYLGGGQPRALGGGPA